MAGSPSLAPGSRRSRGAGCSGRRGNAAGIPNPGVLRSLINNALEAEGMEPLAEDEAGDEGERP